MDPEERRRQIEVARTDVCVEAKYIADLWANLEMPFSYDAWVVGLNFLHAKVEALTKLTTVAVATQRADEEDDDGDDDRPLDGKDEEAPEGDRQQDQQQ